ncbi:hypothetical protein ACFQD2_07655 [Pseudomonas lini]
MEKDFGGHHCAVCRDRALAERTRKPGLRPDPAEEQRKYDEMMARQRTQAEQLNEVWEAKEAREEAAIVKVTLRIGVFLMAQAITRSTWRWGASARLIIRYQRRIWMAIASRTCKTLTAVMGVK